MSEVNKYKRNEKEALEKAGKTIREMRKKAKISQQDLAIHLQCSQDRISRIENGTSRMSLYELMQLCRILDTDPNEVLGYPPKHSMNRENWARYVEYNKLPQKVKNAVSELIKSMG